MLTKEETKFKETEIGFIPEEWEVAELKSLTIKIGSGATPTGGESAYKKSGISLIRSQNIYNNFFSSPGLAFIDNNQAQKLSNVAVEEKDILLNITGDSVARVCQVPDNVLPARVNQHVSIIRTKKNILNPKFLEYYLSSSSGQNRLLSFAGVGATRKALTKSMIEDFEIPLPPLCEQKSISEILSSLDEKIELNRRMNKTLEEMGKVLFKRWFVDFEFPNEDGKPYKSSGGKMVESELGEIPEGWEVKSFKNVCQSITNGGTPSRSKSEFWYEGTIPWVKTGELSDTVITRAEECINDLGLKSSATRLLPVNSIIVAIYAAPTVGRLGIIKVPSATNQACTGLVANEEQISYLHLYYFLLFNRKYFNNISVGAAQQNISKQVIEDTLIVTPSDYRIIESSKDKFELLWNQIHSIHNENQVLMSLRDSLLPKLISGKIRVIKS
jgi:type I restriction enzyme S subunit